jgi:hypothetical protein
MTPRKPFNFIRVAQDLSPFRLNNGMRHSHRSDLEEDQLSRLRS